MSIAPTEVKKRAGIITVSPQRIMTVSEWNSQQLFKRASTVSLQFRVSQPRRQPSIDGEPGLVRPRRECQGALYCPMAVIELAGPLARGRQQQPSQQQPPTAINAAACDFAAGWGALCIQAPIHPASCRDLWYRNFKWTYHNHSLLIPRDSLPLFNRNP